MPFRAPRRGRWIPLCLAAVLCSTSAAADDGNLEDVAAARSLGVEGVKLADGGRCGDAIEKLGRAEKLHHAPTILARLGECQILLGHVVEGTENLLRVLREPLSATAPPAFAKARARAQTIYDSAKPKIARLAITIKAPANVTYAVTLDGQPISALVLDYDRPTDPGEHVVEVKADRCKPANTKLALGPGQRRAVLLTLVIDPDAPTPPAPEPLPVAMPTGAAAAPITTLADGPGGPTGAMKESYEPPRPNHTAAYVALGIGAGGVAVGAVFGALTLARRSDVSSACPDKLCAPNQLDTLNHARAFGNVSTVAFTAGAAGLVTGAALLLFEGKHASGESATPQARGGRTLSGFVAPGGAGIRGTF